jgi:hypothetical protein
MTDQPQSSPFDLKGHLSKCIMAIYAEYGDLIGKMETAVAAPEASLSSIFFEEELVSFKQAVLAAREELWKGAEQALEVNGGFDDYELPELQEQLQLIDGMYLDAITYLYAFRRERAEAVKDAPAAVFNLAVDHAVSSEGNVSVTLSANKDN